MSAFGLQPDPAMSQSRGDLDQLVQEPLTTNSDVEFAHAQSAPGPTLRWVKLATLLAAVLAVCGVASALPPRPHGTGVDVAATTQKMKVYKDALTEEHGAIFKDKFKFDTSDICDDLMWQVKGKFVKGPDDELTPDEEKVVNSDDAPPVADLVIETSLESSVSVASERDYKKRMKKYVGDLVEHTGTERAGHIKRNMKKCMAYFVDHWEAFQVYVTKGTQFEDDGMPIMVTSSAGKQEGDSAYMYVFKDGLAVEKM